MGLQEVGNGLQFSWKAVHVVNISEMGSQAAERQAGAEAGNEDPWLPLPVGHHLAVCLVTICLTLWPATVLSVK